MTGLQYPLLTYTWAPCDPKSDESYWQDECVEIYFRKHIPR